MIKREKEEVSKKKVGRFILIFIILIAISSNGALRSKLLSLISMEHNDVKPLQEYEIILSENYSVGMHNNRVLLYNDKDIYSYDIDGNQTHITSLKYDSPDVEFYGEIIYIADNVNGAIIANDLDGKVLWSINIDNQLSNVLFTDETLSVLSKTKTDNIEILTINTKGKEIFKKEISDNTVLSAETIPNNQGYIISHMDIVKGNLNSTVSMYTQSGALQWSEKYEDEIIQKTFAISDNNIIIVTDKKIYSITGKNQLLWSRSIEGELWDLAMDKKSKRILFLTYSDKAYLEILDLNGRTNFKHDIDKQYHTIRTTEKCTLVYGDTKILGIKDGQEVFDYEFIQNIKDVVLEDNLMAVLTNTKISILKISSR